MGNMATVTRPLQRVSRSIKLSHTPAELWPLLSATDRLNRESGLPPVDYTPVPNPRGGSDLKAQAKFMGMTMTWDEHPYEWEEAVSWRVRRVFKCGPLESGIFGCSLAAAEGGGTNVTYFCEYV